MGCNFIISIFKVWFMILLLSYFYIQGSSGRNFDPNYLKFAEYERINGLKRSIGQRKSMPYPNKKLYYEILNRHHRCDNSTLSDAIDQKLDREFQANKEKEEVKTEFDKTVNSYFPMKPVGKKDGIGQIAKQAYENAKQTVGTTTTPCTGSTTTDKIKSQHIFISSSPQSPIISAIPSSSLSSLTSSSSSMSSTTPKASTSPKPGPPVKLQDLYKIELTPSESGSNEKENIRERKHLCNGIGSFPDEQNDQCFYVCYRSRRSRPSDDLQTMTFCCPNGMQFDKKTHKCSYWNPDLNIYKKSRVKRRNFLGLKRRKRKSFKDNFRVKY